MFIIFLLVLNFVLSTVQCFSPNCIPENQFRNFGFPVEACSDNFQARCKFHPKGYFQSLGDAPLVKIGETTVLPTCAFFNAEALQRINGVNRKIEVLATGAFKNLPNLKAIQLAFNNIREVRKDVFQNISVELLDLSWNKIAFIDSSAFKEVSNLKLLNISRNSLMTLSINNLANTITSLNIAYNLLTSIVLNSDAFTNLAFIDASNNMIDKVAISFKYPTKKIDLTSNRLTDFDYMDVSFVEIFRMGENLFQEAPQYLENINAHAIDIYPNPWKCDALMTLWEILVSFNIRLVLKKSSRKLAPVCTTSKIRLLANSGSINCHDDHECPPSLVCRARQCLNPCEESMCHTNSICETNEHFLKCSCAPGLRIDPLDIHAECKNVECFVDFDCSPGFYCWNQTCMKVIPVRIGDDDDDDEGLIWGSGLPSTPKPQNPWWFEEIPSLKPPVPIPCNKGNKKSLKAL